MSQDEIIKEVRAIREAYAERFDFDVHALYRDAKAHEGQDRRRVLILEPRRANLVQGGQGLLGVVGGEFGRPYRG